MMIREGEQIARVLAGPQAVDICADVMADVTIQHGRTDFGFGAAGISVAKFTVPVARDRLAHWQLGHVGNPIVIDSGPGTLSPWSVDHSEDHGPVTTRTWERRFTGYISDIDYEWEQRADTWYLMHRVTCVGQTARLGSRLAAGTVWAAETTRARATSILAAGGLPYQLQSGQFTPGLIAADRDPSRPLLAELEELSPPAEAVLFDRPDGVLVWQELEYRRTTPIVELPCEVVRFAPGFTEQLDLVNDYTIDWGSDTLGGTVNAADNNSQASRGVWAERGAYPYAAAPDATLKASRVVRRQAVPTVRMPGVQILLNRIDSPQMWSAVRGLLAGWRVRLPQLPDPYPANNTSAPQNRGVWVVEGWTERVGSRWKPDNEWTLDLVLSPPIWSMAAMTWNELNAAYPGKTWNQWAAGGQTWDQIGVL